MCARARRDNDVLTGSFLYQRVVCYCLFIHIYFTYMCIFYIPGRYSYMIVSGRYSLPSSQNAQLRRRWLCRSTVGSPRETHAQCVCVREREREGERETERARARERESERERARARERESSLRRRWLRRFDGGAASLADAARCASNRASLCCCCVTWTSVASGPAARAARLRQNRAICRPADAS